MPHTDKTLASEKQSGNTDRLDSNLADIDSEKGIDSNPNSQAKIEQKKTSFWHLVLTSMAAAIGVQSSKNLAQDFSQKSPFPFIVAGILFTVLFLGSIILIVKYVLSDI